MWIATAEHIRDLDHRASEQFGIPALVLMERAGLAVFSAIQDMLPAGGRLLVVCGKGNNGGDGLVVARLATESQRYAVECVITSLEEDLSPDCRTQLNMARAAGIHPILADDPRWLRRLECASAADLIVDAILGTGASGQLHGPVLDAIQMLNHSGTPVVAVDVPSGIEANTGADLGESVWAVRTVTFGLPKPFLFQGLGMEHAGFWTVADIGYPSLLTEETTDARLLDANWVANFLPERLRNSHKRDHGHVVIVAGSDAMPGAAALSCMGALRGGAGLVTIASTESVCRSVSAVVPEVILHPLPDEDGYLGIAAAKALTPLLDRFDAAVIGPGLGQPAVVDAFLADLFEAMEIPACLDAEALNALSRGVPLPKVELALTPHAGEISRMLKCSTGEAYANRIQTVQDAVAKLGHTVLLKGPHSIIGDPHQPLAINATGNSGMATAGMGDVLSGMIGALLGQDIPPYCATCAAVYWHGLAGDVCAEEIGPVGFLATDVARALPQARAKLLKSCEDRFRVSSFPASCSP